VPSVPPAIAPTAGSLLASTAGRLPTSSVLSKAASPSGGAITLDSLARSIAELTHSVADTTRNVAAMQAAWATLVQPPPPPHPHLISFPPSPSPIPSWAVGPPPPIYSSATPITTVLPLPSAAPTVQAVFSGIPTAGTTYGGVDGPLSTSTNLVQSPLKTMDALLTLHSDLQRLGDEQQPMSRDGLPTLHLDLPGIGDEQQPMAMDGQPAPPSCLGEALPIGQMLSIGKALPIGQMLPIGRILPIEQMLPIGKALSIGQMLPTVTEPPLLPTPTAATGTSVPPPLPCTPSPQPVVFSLN
jgi:hypothetical protein